MRRKDERLAQLAPFEIDPARGQLHLRIMATTDLHVHILPYDYFADAPAPGLGLASVATMVRTLRAEAPGSLLLDNGDFLQGTPMTDMLREAPMPDGTPHPMIAAMNTLGYDAATLGNHEFNYGLDFLQAVIGDAAFPVVSANIARDLGATPGEDHLFRPPWALVTRTLPAPDGSTAVIKVGVIGFAPPQITRWDKQQLAGRIAMRDIVEAAQAHVPALRAAGADVVVALAHSGIGPETATPGMENAVIPLARMAGIDAIVAGHSHALFPAPGAEGRIGEMPVVLPGSLGSHLGVIDLALEREGPRWRVARSRAVALPQDGTEPDAEIVAGAAAAHARTLAHIRAPLAEVTGPLHSYFACVANDAGLGLVTAAQREAVARALTGSAWADLPLLSAASPYRAGGRGGPEAYVDIPPGPLGMRHASALYPFPNPLTAILVDGALLRDWLEHAAAIFLTLVPGAADQPLIDRAAPVYNFDVIAGVSYAIDLSQPALYGPDGQPLGDGPGRIRDLRWNGAPVTTGQRFVVATNGYRAAGGGGFAGLAAAEVVLDSPQGARDAIVDYLRQAGRIAPRIETDWRFAPLPGTSAVFETGPGAMAHLTAVHDRQLQPLGPGADGFARFRLSL
ncbi:MAG: bifunctional 2',3'-cyclic-nucleotide 2'-phosphodiesterase/3'-nucleotidase [Limimaricola sp.]|uniref:bifunctional 2',3'-cyclic-nucleotide 2'-phosphodiesterase/3'-nucleotidase n=1 Tax=Limimaricola sp. TaxID=2211665 RepID=UPI001E001B9C|nr:bifunctional 2',3'-cyclic-nucleotide 2'-phosphodiesterase/3'-nucleotidase [Limimaricola sp.]MBI1417464.1 bifunctional 2',3'-cyclic-nucleotide 2'-phosphodiesterase/3'-nucleotidase [Limimaricola sp.]